MKRQVLSSFLFVTVGSAILSVRVFPEGKTSQPTSPEVSYVLAGINKGRNSISNVRLSGSYESFISKELLQQIKRDSSISKDIDFTDQVNVLSQDGLLSVKIDRAGYNQIPPYTKRLVSDGIEAKVFTEYHPTSVEGKTRTVCEGDVVAPSDAIEDGLWKGNDQWDPRAYVYHAGTQPLDEFLARFSPVATFEGKEKWDDSNFMKVAIKPSEDGEIVYWIDIDHNFLLRRQQSYRMIKGQRTLTGEMTATQLQSVDGLFFPKQIKVESYQGTSQNQGDQTLTATRTLTVKQFDPNPRLPSEAFVFNWPVNTRVEDHIRQTDFTVVTQEVPKDASYATRNLPSAEDDPNNSIAPPTPTVKAGDAALDFSATDMNGQTWKLSQLRGKKNLLLTFFPKCFTGGCANHLSSIRDQQRDFDQAQTQVLAVSVDPADGEKGQKAFASQWEFKFPLIPDTKRTLCKLYGAAQTDKQLAARMSVLIDKQGIVRWVTTDVHIQTHGGDVLAKVKELGLDR